MKREFIHITDNNKHRLMSDSGFWHGSTNENSREKEIAKELGVNSSTVSRHIMKARDKLRHIASYYVN